MEFAVGITAHPASYATKMVFAFALTQTCLLIDWENVPVLRVRSGKVKVEIVSVPAQENHLI